MSNSKKISQLNGITTVLDTDIIPVVNSGETKKVTKANLLKEVNEKIDDHIDNKSNPHEVSKSQVGLGNVDNTSDLNKPISNATATALSGKSNVGHTHTVSQITDFDTEVSNNADVAENTAKRHARNADTKLDEGGSNEVTALAIKSHLGATNNPHNVTKSQVGLGNVTNDAQVKRTEMGSNSGVATLGSDGKIPSSQLPALAITNTFVTNSQVAQLALITQEGDVVVRTDLNKSFIKNNGISGTMADWQELLTPTNLVLSVNGKTGAITLTTSDISEGTNLYFTTLRAIVALTGQNVSILTNDAGYITALTAPIKTVTNSDGTLSLVTTSGAVVGSLKRTPQTVTYNSNITLSAPASFQLYRILATGDITFAKPTGTVDGANIEIWVTASGADRNISFLSDIVVPTSSTFTSPKTIASGKKAKILLQYDATLNGGQWEITSFINGY